MSFINVLFDFIIQGKILNAEVPLVAVMQQAVFSHLVILVV